MSASSQEGSPSRRDHPLPGGIIKPIKELTLDIRSPERIYASEYVERCIVLRYHEGFTCSPKVQWNNVFRRYDVTIIKQENAAPKLGRTDNNNSFVWMYI